MAEEERETVNIQGLDIQVVSDEEAEEVGAVVCVREAEANSNFADNVRASCAECGETVIHRPYVPVKPPKICLNCFVRMNADEEELPPPATSPRGLQDLLGKTATKQ